MSSEAQLLIEEFEEEGMVWQRRCSGQKHCAIKCVELRSSCFSLECSIRVGHHSRRSRRLFLYAGRPQAAAVHPEP